MEKNRDDDNLRSLTSELCYTTAERSWETEFFTYIICYSSNVFAFLMGIHYMLSTFILPLPNFPLSFPTTPRSYSSSVFPAPFMDLLSFKIQTHDLCGHTESRNHR